jgi:hypothetical protein
MMMRSYLFLAGTAIFICRYPWAFSPAPLAILLGSSTHCAADAR